MPALLPALGHRAEPHKGCWQVDGKQKSPSGSSPLYPLAKDQDLLGWQRNQRQVGLLAQAGSTIPKFIFLCTPACARN